jgi:hypothetical protein
MHGTEFLTNNLLKKTRYLEDEIGIKKRKITRELPVTPYTLVQFDHFSVANFLALHCFHNP